MSRILHLSRPTPLSIDPQHCRTFLYLFLSVQVPHNDFETRCLIHAANRLGWADCLFQTRGQSLCNRVHITTRQQTDYGMSIFILFPSNKFPPKHLYHIKSLYPARHVVFFWYLDASASFLSMELESHHNGRLPTSIV